MLFELSANAFLHHMVRNIVGALVHVGKGAAPPEWLARGAREPRPAAAPRATFGPDGLYLAAVEYDPRGGTCPAFPPMLAFAGTEP